MGELWRFFALNFRLFLFISTRTSLSAFVRGDTMRRALSDESDRDSRRSSARSCAPAAAFLSVCAAVELVRLLGLALCTRSQLQLAARSARTAACRKPTVTTWPGAKRQPTACDVATTGCRRRMCGSPDAAQTTKSGGDPEIPAGKRYCRSHPSMKFERWRSQTMVVGFAPRVLKRFFFFLVFFSGVRYQSTPPTPASRLP